MHAVAAAWPARASSISRRVARDTMTLWRF
jgi:hypothetical protein